MREILFRGRRKSDGEWIEGTLFRIASILDPFIMLTDRHAESYEVDSETAGQFTGLTDKNDKKIFEGDVVKFTDSPFGYSYTGVVCFHEGSFCIKYEYWKKEKFHRIGQTDKWQDMGASGIVTYQYEILGNIHDNPELLKNP